MKHLNNKGYLLVEIILASALAISMAYIMINLTIKIKDKNDDLLVESLTSTDQGITYNYFMKWIAEHSEETITSNNIKCEKDGDVYVIKHNTDVVIRLNKYAKCSNPQTIEGNDILIPISVKNLEDYNFDVIIYVNN